MNRYATEGAYDEPRSVQESFENAMLRSRYNGLIRIVDESLSAKSYQDFLARISDALRAMFDAKYLTVHLLSSDKTEFVEQTCHSYVHAFGSHDYSRIPYDAGRASLLMAGRQLVPMSFINPDALDIIRGDSFGGLICSVSVPLFVDDGAFGFFSLVYDHEVNWPRRDLDYLLTVGHLLGVLFRHLHMSGNLQTQAGDLRECRILSREILKELETVLALTRAEKPDTVAGFSADSAGGQRSQQGRGQVERGVDLKTQHFVKAGGSLSQREALAAARSDQGKARSQFISPGDSFRPTYREMQLMAYAAEGLTNKEIAEVLSITEGAVKKMFTRIVQNSGLRNRSQIVAYAVRNGFVL